MRYSTIWSLLVKPSSQPYTSCLHLSTFRAATKPFATERYFLIPSFSLSVYLVPRLLSFLSVQTDPSWSELKQRFERVGGCSSGAFSLRSNLRPGSSTWPVPPSRQFNHTNSTPFPFPALSFTHSTPRFIILHPNHSARSAVFWLKNDIISDLDKRLFSLRL